MTHQFQDCRSRREEAPNSLQFESRHQRQARQHSTWIKSCAPQIAARLLAVRFVSCRSGDTRLAHAAPDCCAGTSALISDTNRSISQISSSSASSAGIRFPAWLRRSNSWARAAAGSDGWKPIISLAAGRRAKKKITSRRKLELRVQVRRSPRSMMSATRSPSGSNCRANCSGISMVTCMIQSLRHNTHQVKLRILASGACFVIRHSSLGIRTCSDAL